VLTYYSIKLGKGGLIMKKKIATLLVASMTLCTVLAGCGQSSSETTTTSTSSSEVSDDTVYAVEAGSAGEAVAEEKGFKYNSVASQADALMEVASGTSDAAIIDLLMAGAMIGEGTSYPNMKYTDELTTEEYGVGCRLGSDLASYINQVFYDSYTDGTMQETAKTYGVQESLVEQPESEYAASDDSDVEYIKSKGTLIVGITDFEPMDYKDSSDNWIGFDADMAKIVAESLGVEIKFVEIDWDNKIMELNSKNIDVVWNGMTLTSEVTESMECTNAYCNNAQVIVVNK
jgi:polar amino acid transport system substrate-binding protein